MNGDLGIHVIEKLLDRRQSRRGSGWCIEYLVRWPGYGPEVDVWYNPYDLDDAPELVIGCDERLGLTEATGKSSDGKLGKSSISTFPFIGKSFRARFPERLLPGSLLHRARFLINLPHLPSVSW